MNSIDLDDRTLSLHKILEAKLLRVFYYTRYSLMVSGQNRLSHYCFFTDHATMVLDQAREITRALILLDSTCDLKTSYDEHEIKEASMADLLKQAIADEKSLLLLCEAFQEQIKRQDIYFCRLAKSLIINTHQRITGLVSLLCEIEDQTPPTALPNPVVHGPDYIPLDYQSLRSA